MFSRIVTLVLSAMWAVSHACAQSTFTAANCEREMLEICGMSEVHDHQSVFDARMCLWSNRDALSAGCYQYVTEISPSIIEPCIDSIVMYCKAVVPGENRIHECLQEVREVSAYKLTNECLAALDADADIPLTMSPAASDENTIFERLHSASSFLSSLPTSVATIFGIDMPAAADYSTIAPALITTTTTTTSTTAAADGSNALELLLFGEVMHSIATEAMDVTQSIQNVLVRVVNELTFLQTWLRSSPLVATADDAELSGMEDDDLNSAVSSSEETDSDSSSSEESDVPSATFHFPFFVQRQNLRSAVSVSKPSKKALLDDDEIVAIRFEEATSSEEEGGDDYTDSDAYYYYAYYSDSNSVENSISEESTEPTVPIVSATNSRRNVFTARVVQASQRNSPSLRGTHRLSRVFS